MARTWVCLKIGIPLYCKILSSLQKCIQIRPGTNFKLVQIKNSIYPPQGPRVCPRRHDARKYAYDATTPKKSAHDARRQT